MDPTDDDASGGLFNIDISSSSADEDATAAGEAAEKTPRDFQSEEDFQTQLREWRPKVERGELYKSLSLPINRPSKPASQAILHAIEELYFYRRYADARRVAAEALRGADLVVEFRKTLTGYWEKCDAKLRCCDLAEAAGKKA